MALFTLIMGRPELLSPHSAISGRRNLRSCGSSTGFERRSVGNQSLNANDANDANILRTTHRGPVTFMALANRTCSWISILQPKSALNHPGPPGHRPIRVLCVHLRSFASKTFGAGSLKFSETTPLAALATSRFGK